MRWRRRCRWGGAGRPPTRSAVLRQGRPLISSLACRSIWMASSRVGVRTSPDGDLLCKDGNTPAMSCRCCGLQSARQSQEHLPSERDPTSPTASCSLQSAPPKPSETTPISHGTRVNKETSKRGPAGGACENQGGNLDTWLPSAGLCDLGPSSPRKRGLLVSMKSRVRPGIACWFPLSVDSLVFVQKPHSVQIFYRVGQKIHLCFSIRLQKNSNFLANPKFWVDFHLYLDHLVLPFIFFSHYLLLWFSFPKFPFSLLPSPVISHSFPSCHTSNLTNSPVLGE